MRWFWLAISTWTMTGLTLAQEFTVESPKPVTGEKSSAMLWLFTALFLGGCLFVAFKPAKRSKLE